MPKALPERNEDMGMIKVDKYNLRLYREQVSNALDNLSRSQEYLTRAGLGNTTFDSWTNVVIKKLQKLLSWSSDFFRSEIENEEWVSEKSKAIVVGGKIAGVVVGKVFIKHAIASRHFLRVPPAIAFDVSAINRAREAGAMTVMVLDKESGKRYYSLITTIQEKGVELDRGCGRQVALAMRYWSNSPPAQPVLFDLESVQKGE
jgi:hypothetical protein